MSSNEKPKQTQITFDVQVKTVSSILTFDLVSKRNLWENVPALSFLKC